jgi:uncharacterized protein involved in exopolysaccharide biosynthesis
MSDQKPTIPGDPHKPYPYDEDEINLLDLFLVLLKYKKMIIVTVVLAAIGAVIVSLLMTNIYRSSATIAPQATENTSPVSALSGLGAVGGFLGIGGNTDLSKLEVVLKSRELTRRLITKYKLLPLLFADNWDTEKKAWRTDKPPTEQDAIGAAKNIFSVSADIKKEIITVNVDHRDPAFAKKMVEYYLTELSEILRETTLRDAEEKVHFLQEELSRTSDVLLKEKISELLANEIEKETFARAQKYYSFEVIDPPIVPDLDKKVKPKRALICILSVVVAFFLAVFAAFFLEFVHNIKKDAEPEQLERLHKYSGFKEKNS